MKRLWLIFAQTTTAGLAVWFLLSLLNPELLQKTGEQRSVVTVQQSAQNAASAPEAAPVIGSYSGAVKRAMPAVVNIYTAKEVRTQRPPIFNDPLFQRFFGDRFGDEPSQKASSLGNGVIVPD